VYRHWIREFSKHHQYIRYDERGCGLSDWDVDLSFEAWVRDLETVVDSLGLEKFDLLGVSQGGAVSMAYSVRHPERVNHLVLYGAYARGWGNRNLSPAELEEAEAQITLMKLGWGKDNPSARQIFTSKFIPDATLEEIHAFNDLQKVSTSPENAIRFQSVFKTVNVLDMLPKLSVPTMILHLQEDASVPFWLGREMATRIPNARFIPLEGKDHILLEHDPAWNIFLHEVRDFLGVKETQLDSPVPSELGLPGWLKRPRKK
jgi:pimeloyl-ACP methyl ester carboxylesterase